MNHTNPPLREFKKLKELSDYNILDAPELVDCISPQIPYEQFYVLRMLVRPKYGDFKIPESLIFLADIIDSLSVYDHIRTGINDSWCYVTIRHGIVTSETDDDFHFDGSSFRTDIIPERNYIWSDHSSTEYKTGNLDFPFDFNPMVHNLFTFADQHLNNTLIKSCNVSTWYLLSPFCLHRRPQLPCGIRRTFYRISFSDIEIRDVNNTENPLIQTSFYGRNPVLSFRNKLIDYIS